MLKQFSNELGVTYLQKGITIFTWPVLVLTMLFSAYTLFKQNIPLGAIAFTITISTLVIIYLLQLLNPLNKKWQGQLKETQLDLSHILLSEGMSHAIITSVASWIGFSIGFDLWRSSGLDLLPLWIQFSIGLAILDLGLYWQHRILHEVPSLWKAHLIHHAIRSLSPTRAGRHHPISPVITTFIWITLTGLGLPPIIFIMCQAFAITNGLLQHSNIRIKIGPLEYIFASPTFHRWHHSLIEQENNRNFGPNLSIWDQIPWHKIPIFGRVLRFQYTTFYRGKDDGPTEIGLEEPCLIQGKGILYNWWYQVSEPIKYWLKISR